MKIFLLKSFFLLALMSISVLAGIQMADNGIHQMTGKDHSNSFRLPDQQESLDTLESDPSSHDIQLKQEKLKKMNTFNLFSSMGKKMSEGILKTSEKVIDSIAN